MTMHRIAESIVAGIALQRAVPSVFLLDERGCPIVWPRSGDNQLPAAIVVLLDMYFAQEPARRARFCELVEIDGADATVRIIPELGVEPRRFALILEPFAVRARRSTGSGTLSSTP
jgi:hypothetical protein